MEDSTFLSDGKDSINNNNLHGMRALTMRICQGPKLVSTASLYTAYIQVASTVKESATVWCLRY